MTSNKNEDEILGLSNKNIRKEILLFKEEVLKDMKVVKKEFENKFNNLENELKEQINLYEIKVSTFEEKIKNLSNLIVNDRSLIQKIDELSQFKDETRDKILTDSIKIINIENDYKMNFKNIENILSSTVIYPGLIGFSGKFKSFHDFMDYVLLQIQELNAFKEKSIVELGPYKKKIDENLDNIKLQVNHIINSSNEFTLKKVSDCEQKMKSLIQLYDDRLQDTRVENAHYAIKLEKKSEDLSNLIKNIYEVRTDIYSKVKEEVSSVKGEQRTLLRLFTSYKKEFGSIKNKFIQLSEFIRDVRFRVNLDTDVKKKEFVAISKKLSFLNKGNISFGSNKKKSLINRAETFDLNKKYQNTNYDIFETPYNANKETKLYSNTYNFNKRGSLQVNNLQKFSNKLLTKFDSLDEPNEENKNKKCSNNSSKKLIRINKNINNYGNGISDIFASGEKQKKFNRRNTAAVAVPITYNKDFHFFNQKNFNNKANNDLINSDKIQEEKYLYSSKSSSEDIEKNNSEIGEKEKDKKNSFQISNNNKEKKEFIIKEEDENNGSEITADENNKQKSSKDIKNLKKDNERKSKSVNKEGIEENNNIIPSKKEEIKEEKNKEENKVGEIKEKVIEEKREKEKEIEINKENKEGEIINNEKNNNIYLNTEKTPNILSHNSINNKFVRNKTFSAKILNKKDKSINLRNNQNEFKQKENPRNNIVSIVNINEMFLKNNNDHQKKRYGFFNYPNNLYLALSPENYFLNKNKTLYNMKMPQNKNKISLLSKSNKTFGNSPINNIDKTVPQHLLIKKKFMDSLDIDMKSDQPYKTYSNFPKFNLEGYEGNIKLNTKIIYLSGKKNKKNEFAINFLNKPIKKTTLKKEQYIYNYNKK